MFKRSVAAKGRLRYKNYKNNCLNAGGSGHELAAALLV